MVAQGCHLCEDARLELRALGERLGFELEELDITGVPELEDRYRVFVPVVEVGGERVSVFGVEEGPLRHKLGLG